MKALGLLLVVYVCSFFTPCFGQVTFTGSTEAITTDDNASPVIVDNALSIVTPHLIDGAKVTITSNFTLGDQLSYTPLPPSSPSITGSYDPATGTLTFTGNAYANDYQTILQSVTFTAFASGASNRVIEFYLGAKSLYKVNNHYYEYVPHSEVSWTTAKDNAALRTYFGLQGYLANITSSGENQFLQQNIGKGGWIGATDDIIEVNKVKPTIPLTDQWNVEANFYWVTGPEKGTQFSERGSDPKPVNSQYYNWISGEPNGWIYVNYVKFKENGGWDDMAVAGESWDRVNGYYVEYGGFTGEPTTDVTHSRTIEVKPTTLTTTSYPNHVAQNVLTVVDPNLVLKSGGIIANARIAISSNFTSGDELSFNSQSLPTGVTGSYNPTTGILSFTGTAIPSAWQALFRSITFQSSSINSNDRAVSFSIGNIVRGSNGHFYEYVKDVTYTWTEAFTAAATRSYMGLQGYLATITGQDENDLIDQKLRADGWLGGSDEYTVVNTATGTTNYANQDASEGKFYWVTGPEKGQLISTGNGSPVRASTNTYMHWYNGEPNNAGPEHYLEIYSTRSGAPGEWNDLPNSSQLGMVVEYGGLPIDPIEISISASRILTYAQVLPVRGLSFQVKEKGNDVVLNWSVLMEDNVKRYDVLSSVNGSNFRKIGEVKALDKSNPTSYSYTDRNPVNGNNYYKIVVVDEDGQLHYSDVRSITIAEKIQVYPTIINDHFTVQQPNPNSYLLTVTNVSGHKLLQKTVTQGINQIETGLLTGGTYFVQIYTGAKEPRVFKIIKK